MWTMRWATQCVPGVIIMRRIRAQIEMDGRSDIETMSNLIDIVSTTQEIELYTQDGAVCNAKATELPDAERAQHEAVHRRVTCWSSPSGPAAMSFWAVVRSTGFKVTSRKLSYFIGCFFGITRFNRGVFNRLFAAASCTSNSCDMTRARRTGGHRRAFFADRLRG